MLHALQHACRAARRRSAVDDIANGALDADAQRAERLVRLVDHIYWPTSTRAHRHEHDLGHDTTWAASAMRPHADAHKGRSARVQMRTHADARRCG